jgi:DeoR family fructose operon transcriptional repressor
VDARQRHSTILDLARSQGGVDVTSLVTDLGVAPETIRRDLRVLVDRGVLRRVHGGAVAVESTGFETPAALRTTSQVEQKRRIAAAAAALVEGAESVYIDEGFTPQLVAEALATSGPDGPARGLTVVTPSLPTAQMLAAHPHISVLVLGGRMRARTLATLDHWALRMLSELSIDLAFLGANGISRDLGLTTPDPAVAAVKQEAVRRSRRRVVVGVHTKFGTSSFCRFAAVTDFEAIVTGRELSARDAQRYEAMGPRVIRA